MGHLTFAIGSFDHDTYRDRSNFALLTNSDAILQTVKTRLLTHYEEYFLDLSIGVPYFTEILVHHPNYSLIESVLLRTINDTDGVERVVTFEMLALPDRRNMSVSFSYIDVYGNTVEGTI